MGQIGNVHFEKAILAGKPVNPEEYPPFQKKLWDSAIASGMPIPPDYTGSIHMDCTRCQTEVQVGPRSQEVMKTTEVTVYCLICVALVAKEFSEDDQSVGVISLDNPEGNLK